MAIAPGTKLGSYEVRSPLGAGGMGEVFRARDLKLERDVALKVLPPEFASSPERLRRFEREARSASALNHPHIVAICDVGQSDSISYIAMELVDGRTLRDLLSSGLLPVKKALQIAAQIADGLAKAHAAGIVHRDLKPENLMVTRDGFAKILDFGLAKATAAETPSTADSPTLPASSTIAGMVVGTVGYMSPEQARGAAVDFRSDQFSFGSVLYEMITGERAFRRESAAQTLTAIIEDEPRPMTEANAKAPPPLRWIVERCLAKDAEERYASTRDLARDLANVRDHLSESSMPEVVAGTRPSHLRPRHLVLMALLTAAVIAAGVAGYRLGRPQVPGPLSMRALTFAGSDAEPTVSPDGRTVAFTSSRDGQQRIWLKQLEGGGEVPLTSGLDSRPRFSPDGAAILFIRRSGRQASVMRSFEQGGDLYRVATVGGEPRKLLSDVLGADWSPDGTQIVFVRMARVGDALDALATEVGILQANEENPKALAMSPKRNLDAPRWSPDGKSIVLTESFFGLGGAEAGHTVIGVEDGKVRMLPPPLPGGYVSPLVWSGSGGEAIYTQGESAARAGAATWGSTRVLRLNMATGEAQVLFSIPTVAADVEILDRGTLLFTGRTTRQNLIENSLRPGAGERWLTRGSSSDRQPILSPDGEWVAFTSNRSGNLEVWAVSNRSGILRRLTDHAADDWDPAFMEGGKRILWSSNRGGHFEVWTAEADGSRPRQVSQDGADAENPTATPDGQWIVYQSGHPEKRGVWKMRADGSEATQLVGGTTAWPEVSPDGRHALYTVLQPGRNVVRVVRLTDGQVLPFEIAARNGTGRARWMPGGRAIAFIDQDEQGRTGVFAQDFYPGRDTSQTRRPLAGFHYDLEAESFAFSPDGAKVVVAMLEYSSNLLVAEGVPGVEPVKRKE